MTDQTSEGVKPSEVGQASHASQSSNLNQLNDSEWGGSQSEAPSETQDVQLTPEPVSNAQSEPAPKEKIMLSLDVELPILGTKVTVKKLKAGDHFKAQKIYNDIVRTSIDLLREVNQGRLGKLVNRAMQNGDNSASEKDLKDLEQNLGDTELSSIKKLSDAGSDLAEQQMELVAICLQVSIDNVKNDYYPEDFKVLYGACMLVNNFAENIKKSETLMAGKGQVTQ